MKTYKILWKQVRYGESFVKAKSKKEAVKLADAGKDTEFEDYDEYPAWTMTGEPELYDEDEEGVTS